MFKCTFSDLSFISNAAKVATGLSIAANFLLCVANVFVYLLLSTGAFQDHRILILQYLVQSFTLFSSVHLLHPDSRYGTYCEDPSIFIIGCAAFNMAVSVVAVVMLHLLRWPLPQPPPPHYLPRTATIMAVVLFGQFVWQCLGTVRSYIYMSICSHSLFRLFR